MNYNPITIKLGFVEGEQDEANVLRILSKPHSNDNGSPVPITLYWRFGGDMELEDEQILTAIQAHTSISYLEIVCENYSSDYLNRLRETLATCKVPHVKLELALHPGNSEEQAEALINTLEAALNNSHIATLDLPYNRLGLLPENLFLRLCHAVRNSQVQALDLSHNKIGVTELKGGYRSIEYSVQPLAEALASLSNLHTLNVGTNSLGFSFLLTLIKNSTVVRLSLMNSSFFYGEHEELLAALDRITSRQKIKELDLRSTLVWLDQEYRALYLTDFAKLLKDYTPFQRIDLSKNYLTPAEKNQLKKAAEQRQARLTLVVEEREIYEIEPQALEQTSDSLLTSPQHSDTSSSSTSSSSATSTMTPTSPHTTFHYPHLLSEASTLFSGLPKQSVEADESKHASIIDNLSPR